MFTYERIAIRSSVSRNRIGLSRAKSSAPRVKPRQGVVANSFALRCHGAIGFIDAWIHVGNPYLIDAIDGCSAA
jgi:hypothetical protein